MHIIRDTRYIGRPMPISRARRRYGSVPGTRTSSSAAPQGVSAVRHAPSRFSPRHRAPRLLLTHTIVGDGDGAPRGRRYITRRRDRSVFCPGPRPESAAVSPPERCRRHVPSSVIVSSDSGRGHDQDAGRCVFGRQRCSRKLRSGRYVSVLYTSLRLTTQSLWFSINERKISLNGNNISVRLYVIGSLNSEWNE